MIRFDQISRCLGSIKESNNDIADIVQWDADEIFNKTGIKTRYIALENETSEYLASKAAESLDKNLLKECDLIISVTNTGSYDFPPPAYFINSIVNTNNAKCIGINSGCTGFVDAIEIVYAFFKSSLYKRALIINTDTYSKFLYNNRSTRTLFSDGATATIVSKDVNHGFKVKKTIASIQKNSENVLCRSSANNINEIQMNGPKVLQFAISSVLPDLKKIFPKRADCIFLPHQAGKLVIDLIEKKLPENIHLKKNYKNYGNLVSASIPNLMIENLEQINFCKHLLISGFGVGLSHNSILLYK